MTATQRRATLYALLLLGPALLVGGGALWLLQREQMRLAAEALAARNARHEAVAARVRLIAENVGVLLADMQSSLTEILQDVPLASPESALAELKDSNPFVSSVFVADARGRVVWGDQAAAGLMTPITEEVLGGAAQPRRRVSSDHDAALAEAERLASGAARQQSLANVAQYQAARSDFREEVQAKTSADSARIRKAASVPVPSAALAGSSQATSAKKMAPEPDRDVIKWIPRMDDSPRRLWVRRERVGDGMIGAGIDLRVLRSRLVAVLPAALERDETYALLAPGETLADEGQDYRTSIKVGRAAGRSVVRVALSDTLLPGWSVVGTRPPDAPDESTGGGLMLLGGLVVAGLVGAIALGGALLWREARRQALEASRRTTFVANVSHEFKTPLTTIRLFAELLGQGRVAEPSRRTEYLTTIGDEAARLTRMVENVLRLGRLESGEHRVRPVPGDPGELVRSVVALQAAQIETLGLTLSLAIPGELPRIAMDRDAVQQILTNLIDNAVKYGAAGGVVDVAIRTRESGGVEIEVADRGPGVSAADRGRIFESFQRGDERLSADHSGVGLGLGIARSLARAHGGDLRYETRAESGACFILTLA